MKKQATKTKTAAKVKTATKPAKRFDGAMELLSPPVRGTKVWVSEAKHKQGPIAILSTADGTVVACSFTRGRSLKAVASGWQRDYKQLSFETGKAPKAPNYKKAAPIGTAFQRAVWLAIAFIPKGCVAAYADIAVAIGRPKAMRAVGNAAGKNPLAPFVPCHRVIAANGTIGGYTGSMATKRALLKEEGTVL